MHYDAKKFRFGIFVIVSSLALLALIVIVTSQQLLKKKDIYYIAYENTSVSGLEVGSPVKYLGIKVGTIQDIYIDPEDINRVVVKVGLDKDTPIKKDSKAGIATIGITGLKMIEIKAGSQEAPLLEPGGYIKAGTSMTEQISGKAEVIASKLEHLLNNLNKFTQPEKLDAIIEMANNSAKVFNNANELILQNRGNLHRTIVLGEQAAARLDSMAEKFNQMSTSLNQIIGSDSLKQILGSLRDVSVELSKADLVNLIKEMGEVAAQTNQILTQVDYEIAQGSESFNRSMQKLHSSLDYLNDAARQVSEDPSVLLRGTKPKEIPDKNLEP